MSYEGVGALGLVWTVWGAACGGALWQCPMAVDPGMYNHLDGMALGISVLKYRGDLHSGFEERGVCLDFR